MERDPHKRTSVAEACWLVANRLLINDSHQFALYSLNSSGEGSFLVSSSFGVRRVVCLYRCLTGSCCLIWSVTWLFQTSVTQFSCFPFAGRYQKSLEAVFVDFVFSGVSFRVLSTRMFQNQFHFLKLLSALNLRVLRCRASIGTYGSTSRSGSFMGGPRRQRILFPQNRR